MSLSEAVESSENKYKKILELYFTRIWGNTFLGSHDIEHHRRVWRYARELLIYAGNSGKNVTSIDSDKLIITCFLHDLGMSADPGQDHGFQSKKLCFTFLEENNLPESDFEDVLIVIENHDKKDYQYHRKSIDLFSLLSVADDLDAFGFTGIFRYIEIYLARGIHPSEIGKPVSVNAEGRFRNFVSIFGFSEPLVSHHRERYQVLDLFFRGLSLEKEKKEIKEIKEIKESASGSFTGYMGVTEYIAMAMNYKIQLRDLTAKVLKETNDPVIRWFFSNLEKENDKKFYD
jgi:HD superfamily phosphodiesterase